MNRWWSHEVFSLRPCLVAGLVSLLVARSALAEGGSPTLRLPGLELDVAVVTRMKSESREAVAEVKKVTDLLELKRIVTRYFKNDDLDALERVTRELRKWDAGKADGDSVGRLETLAAYCNDAESAIKTAVVVFNEVADKAADKNGIAAELLKNKAADLDREFVAAVAGVRNVAKEKIKAAQR